MMPSTAKRVHYELKADDPDCKVCGGFPTGTQYGVSACTPCTSFFRRRMKRKEILICENASNCVINTSTRGYCLACRLEKCLKMGMTKAPKVVSSELNLNSSLENLIRLHCASKDRKMESLGAKIEVHKSVLRRAIFEGYFNPKSRIHIVKYFSNKMSPCQMLSLRVQVVRLYASDRNVFHKDGSEAIILPKKISKMLTENDIQNLIKNNIIRQDELQTQPEQAAEVPQQNGKRSTRNETLLRTLLSTIQEFQEVMKNKKKSK